MAMVNSKRNEKYELCYFIYAKALFKHNIFAHNIEIKRYCNKKIKRHFFVKIL